MAISIERTLDPKPGVPELTGAYFSAASGVFVGDKHDETSIRQQLAIDLPKLAESGVRTLYLEMLPSSAQTIIDQYTAEPNETNREQLHSTLASNWGWGEETLEQNMHLLELARVLGVRIVGIESESITSIGREKAWEQAILLDQSKAGVSKFLVFAGRDHEDKYGLASMLNIPSYNYMPLKQNSQDEQPHHTLECSSASKRHRVVEMPRNEEEFKKVIAFLEHRITNSDAILERLKIGLNNLECERGINGRFDRNASFRVFDGGVGWCGRLFKYFYDQGCFDPENCPIGIIGAIVSSPVWISMIILQPIYSAIYRGVVLSREHLTSDPIAQAEGTLRKIFDSKNSEIEKRSMLDRLIKVHQADKSQLTDELRKVKEMFEERFLQRLDAPINSPVEKLFAEISERERVSLVLKEPISESIKNVDKETIEEISNYLAKRENRTHFLTLEKFELPGSDSLSLSINNQVSAFPELSFEERQSKYAQIQREIREAARAYLELGGPEISMSTAAGDSFLTHLSISDFAASLVQDEVLAVKAYLEQPNNLTKILSGRVEQQSGRIEEIVTTLLEIPSSQRRAAIEELLRTLDARIELAQATSRQVKA